MGLHSFIEFIRYQWTAKGRHGTHSPFVYDFVEHVLLDKSILDRTKLIETPGIELKYENLVTRIATYYRYTVVCCTADALEPAKHIDLLVINENNPGTWMNKFKDHLQWLGNDGAVIALHIHKTKAHSAAWKRMTKQPPVRMSIDLFGLGVLFFKEEFKERQHFVLKY